MRAKGMTAKKLATSLLLLAVSVFLLFLILRGLSSEEPSATEREQNGPPWLETPPLKRVRSRAIELSGKDFVVLGKKKRILSGAVHYFRVVPDYWRDRLLKLKAMGLNTVET